MEETLYDLEGNPIAYIAYDNNTIYLWNGTPVAYLEPDSTIYGYNGKHLGWFEQGVMRNLNGEWNGFNKAAANVFVKFEPFKAFKQFLPFKSFKEFKHIKPTFGSTKSKESLSQFLMRGKV